jgi:hypothetical protein
MDEKLKSVITKLSKNEMICLFDGIFSKLITIGLDAETIINDEIASIVINKSAIISNIIEKKTELIQNVLVENEHNISKDSKRNFNFQKYIPLIELLLLLLLFFKIF